MSEAPAVETTLGKALKINKDLSRYGAFAEIGAGQEVARHFFQAGKASQTIAKTISAYDMIVSDDIYGREANGRYVCESRLQKMLGHEYDLLVDRLAETRGKNTCFFSFANTVATASSGSNKQSHGWMGVRFQTKPNGPSNDIILHVRMLDRHRLQQQEALGVLGVNLLNCAFYGIEKVTEFIPHLVEGLKEGQIIIDVIKFNGPALKHFDVRLMNLELVRRKLAEAILFSPQNEILNVSDAIYGKSLLIQRGTFRPVTSTHLDVFQKGLAQMKGDVRLSEGKDLDVLPMMELTMHNLQMDGHLNEKDFLDRVETLTSLGFHVLISNFFLFYNLKRFIRRYNSHFMALVVGATHLEKLFTEDHYKNLEGGLLEGLGKLLEQKTKVYIYPHKTSQVCLTTKSFFPAPHLRHIYAYFSENKQIVDISGCDETADYLHSIDVMKMIEAGNPAWENLVPASVRDLIKAKQLFGYKK
ncbi:hypothetical protein AZI85_14080 [Bdellovibrio bacteriovorus]|uniref:Nicotinate-nucleotide adenylyltransferase n=1 Tax=Bdellovibrio bacteriovorus TaxID=959 RepID=A0A150WUS7_BDEBC|nr:hypothetical protein [Bdellovibrio bacteriovorus]KYG70268.1 hypothetical protein AZI85_14080 [Bdellovibrio bacteriovorus]